MFFCAWLPSAGRDALICIVTLQATDSAYTFGAPAAGQAQPAFNFGG